MRAKSSDRRIAQALRWMANVFSTVPTSYQLVGGCAAHAYGATRPVHDIDVYVPGRHLASVAAAMGDHVAQPPKQHAGTQWRLTYLKAWYAGWRVEVADAESTMYYDARARTWRPAVIDFDASETHTLFGVEVAVMPQDTLLTYKRRLDRPVDQTDLRQMQA
jgi:hypothetical protein